MSKNLGYVILVGLLLIAAYTAWAIVNAMQEVTRGPSAFSSGVATQANQFFNPTPTIYPDRVTVILQVRSLARLETAQYTVEKVVTAETGQGTLGPLFGDRLLFVAHGNVIAGVDLSKLSDKDVSVSPEGKVTVILPAAQVFISELDNDKSYVYDRQTGVFTHGDVNLETQARQVAEVEIEKAALEDGILRMAQTNAQSFVERWLESLKFTEIEIIQATPMP